MEEWTKKEEEKHTRERKNSRARWREREREREKNDNNGSRSCVFEWMCEYIHVSKVQADSSGKLGVK